jgi:hypothetical protein
MRTRRKTTGGLAALGLAALGLVGAAWQVLETADGELRIRCAPIPKSDPCAGDIDGDGVVGPSDYLLLSSHFGQVCEVRGDQVVPAAPGGGG